MLHTHRHRILFTLKAALAIAIVVAIARYFAKILGRSELDTLQFGLRVHFLVPAGGLYLLAHCCWGSFWVRLLHGQGVRVSWYGGLRAYFVSQLGKYLPGKAWVILIRVGMLRHDAHAASLPVAVTATYETLTSMAAGAFLGVLLLPYLGVLPPNLSGYVVAFLAVAALPVGLGILNKLAARLWAKRKGPDARPLPAPSLLLLVQGLLHGVCGHVLLGLSLGLVILAVVPEGTADGTYPADLAAVTISYVAGFVFLFAPGGLGVREGALQLLLTPRFVPALGQEGAAALAVIVALVLRLVWTVAEVLLAGTLYFLHPRAEVLPGQEVPTPKQEPQPVKEP